MHLYRRTKHPSRRLGEVILARGRRFKKGRFDGEAATGLFPPADAVKTLQPRVVFLVY
jgi:hypothetical protein